MSEHRTMAGRLDALEDGVAKLTAAIQTNGVLLAHLRELIELNHAELERYVSSRSGEAA